MKKRDLLFIGAIAAIVLVLWAAPPESRLKVPLDDTHRELKAVLERQGKKAAEKSCQDCHNDKDLPLSKDHPPKYRCLFCHKFAEAEQKTGQKSPRQAP